jgi:DNA replication protein DnaC
LRPLDGKRTYRGCRAAIFFFQLETGAIVTTSNRSIAEWRMVFADPMHPTAILDKLLHHNHALVIHGDKL